MYPQVIILWSTIKILEIFRIAMLVQMTKQNSITRKTQIFCITLFCSVFISFENNLFKVTILRSICNLLYLKNSLMIRFLIFLYLYSIIYTFATIKFSSYFLLIFFLFLSFFCKMQIFLCCSKFSSFRIGIFSLINKLA